MTVTAAGTFTYTPTPAARQAATATTTDTFTVTASDGVAATPETVTVSVSLVVGTPVGTPTTITGTDVGYGSSPYYAWQGIYAGNVTAYSGSIVVYPNSFPSNTTINWNLTPKSGLTNTINAWSHVDYGNYQGDPVSITPAQNKNITALQLNVNWTLAGVAPQDVLSELWLTTSSDASGGFSDYDFEVGFLPYVSPGIHGWLAGLTSEGTFTDVDGVTWNIARGTSGVDNVPYLVVYLPGYASHEGVLDFGSFLAALRSKGVITGNEWVNGVAFGVESDTGAGSLTINSYATPVYTTSSQSV